MLKLVSLSRMVFVLLLVLTIRISFAADTGVLAVPVQVHGIYVYVDVQINGKPATFVLDTGASANAVTPEAAARLGLTADTESATITGAAAAGGAAPGTHIATLTVGTREWKDQIAYIVALPEGLECDGLLGTPFLRDDVVTIDYEQGFLTMLPSAVFKPSASATALPLRLTDDIPFVEAKANGHTGWFRLDTGAGNAITLFDAFVKKNHLKDELSPGKKTPTGRGVGGVLYGSLVRLPEFAVGPFRWARPVTELSGQTQGTFGDRKNAGNLGGEIWQRFTLTLDYGHRKIYLKPNALFDRPFNTPRTGLSVDTMQRVKTVIAVDAGSPGAEAGIVKGDVILAVNDVPVPQMKSWEFAALLRGKPGTQVRLRVRSRDGKEREALLTLRDLL